MEHLYTGLESSPRILNELLEDIPESRYEESFSGKFWSIKEHMIHLVETQHVFLERIRLFQENESPEITPFVPPEEQGSGDTNPSIAEILMDFSALREKQLEILRSLPGEVLSRKGQHGEHEIPLSFRRLVQHFLSHDHFHIYRIEELGSFKEKSIAPL